MSSIQGRPKGILRFTLIYITFSRYAVTREKLPPLYSGGAVSAQKIKPDQGVGDGIMTDRGDDNLSLEGEFVRIVNAGETLSSTRRALASSPLKSHFSRSPEGVDENLHEAACSDHLAHIGAGNPIWTYGMQTTIPSMSATC